MKTKAHKLSLRTLSAIMALIMCFVSLPMAAFAMDIGDETSNVVEPAEDMPALKKT